ncbi:hypothetical protein GRI75_12615 [Altererythrobacter soli]|uniref:Uncharacterized protein n=1 Tax=Croceibacterium soli TaxID=1739690 RepID=A0A6I4UY20_9SPHN|nr:hypothetical protein [Croceibacterium soli]MXP42483.1 hypothetical protein [Croceibacterium soli]
MSRANVLAGALLLVCGSAAAGQSSPPSRVETFADLPYWPGYWVSEYTLGTEISGIAPSIRQAREKGEPLRNFMNLAGASAPWNEEGRRRWAEVREIARGRKAQGWGFPMMMNAATPVQFLITPEEVQISNSYNEVRHIYTDGRAMPPEADMWPTVYGTSIGRWEGSTLVIETAMVSNPSDYFHGAPPFSEQARYLERIRLEDDRLVADVTVTDPLTLREPWTVTVSWLRDAGFDRMIQIDWNNDRTSFDGDYNTIEAEVVE